MPAADTLGPLPRYRRPWRAADVAPPASAAAVLGRGLRWSWAAARLCGRVGLDALRGRTGAAVLAVHLREMFELMGATAVKLGQQLSIRVDMLPYALCQELAKLTDRAAPIPFPEAEAQITRALGQPLSAVFSAFDPQPIGAASIACVYRARLREEGTWVAVKVKRPGIAQQFSADLSIFDAWSRTLEALAVVRAGFFAGLRAELRAVFLDELDFVREARLQGLFRQMAREDRLDWLTSPKVYRAWSTADVLVSELVEGVSGTALVEAAEANDAAALAALAEQGIDPAAIARRMLHISNWGRFEALFFHADPHPANFIVLPGGRICLLDFGACGAMSRPVAQMQLEIIDRFLNDDVSSIAELTMASLSPIPAVDRDWLRRESREAFETFLFGVKDPNAAWHERSTAGLWLTTVEMSQRHQLQMNLNMVSMMRATLLYDSVAVRLDGGVDTGAEQAVYQREAAARWRQRAEARARQEARRRRPGLSAWVAAERARRALAVLGRRLARQGAALQHARREASVWAAAVSMLPSQLAVLGLAALAPAALGAGAGVVWGLLAVGVVLIGARTASRVWRRVG